MSLTDKQQLRRRMREAIPEACIMAEESAAIVRQLEAWPCLREAGMVAAFMPLKREPDILPLVIRLSREGRLALPRIADDGMTFHRVMDPAGLAPTGAFGIREPDATMPVVLPEDIELMLVPLEAVSPDGRRLGKGGGYYDRYIARCGAVTCGIAFSWQITENVPVEPWDRPVRYVATAHAIMMVNDKEVKAGGAHAEGN